MGKWVHRFYESRFDLMLKKGKVLVIYGSRQVGKTSLIKKFLSDKEKVYYGDGNDYDLQNVFHQQRLTVFKNVFSAYNYLFIDEAQKISNIGEGVKLIIDHLPETSIILSGSSSFGLSGKIGEPLTGRQAVYSLYPLSASELSQHKGGMDFHASLDNLLIYGCYPEAYTSENNEIRSNYLINLRNSYLLKDILELENVRNPSKLLDLLRLLAFQIGNEVSLNELSNQLGIAKQTIERYLDLLEKVFIIVKVQGFSKNLRKEITKTHRYYFCDNGVRNSIINNFNALNLRNDTGMLWENFLFTERIKTRHYLGIYANAFFWRTYDQKEIDLIEERDGNLYAYEFKWKAKKTVPPKLWTNTYPDSDFRVIDRENYMDFLLPA
jgi:hypothetical protein